MRRTGTLIALIALASAAHAQEAPTGAVRAGTTVRVTLPPNQRVVGTVVSFDADSVVLAQKTTTLRLATSRITKLEIAEGRAHKAPTAVGATLGALVGGVVGAAVGGGSSESPTASYVGTEGGAAQGIVIGAAAGALVGGILGYQRPRWHWRDAAVPRVGIVPNGRGVAVSFAF